MILHDQINNRLRYDELLTSNATQLEVKFLKNLDVIDIKPWKLAYWTVLENCKFNWVNKENKTVGFCIAL